MLGTKMMTIHHYRSFDHTVRYCRRTDCDKMKRGKYHSAVPHYQHYYPLKKKKKEKKVKKVKIKNEEYNKEVHRRSKK